MRRAVDKRQSMRLSVRLLGASTPHLDSGGMVVSGGHTAGFSMGVQGLNQAKPRVHGPKMNKIIAIGSIGM